MAAIVSNLTPSFRALPISIAQLSLSAVLKCGQSFRWSAYPLPNEDQPGATPSHEYRFCLRDRVVCLRQTLDTLYYRSEFPIAPIPPHQLDIREAETLSWLRDYFQLDVDLLDLYDQWSTRDAVFLKIRESFSGIRILRQDPFECLISFICSSNNNISRITNMVNALCKEFSPPLLKLPPPDVKEGLPETYHPFPSPSALAAPEVAATLRKLGFGYRAEFIQRTAKMLVDTHSTSDSHEMNHTPELAEVWLATLREMSTAEAREELLKFVGVGRKVADCVLLMSLDKTDVVPVDTHVHQIAVKHYGMSGSSSKTNMTPKLYEQLTTKFTTMWGPYAGWAHSVLFTSDLKVNSSVNARSPSKRKRAVAEPASKIQVVSTTAAAEVIMAADSETMSDRVKRRRRR